MAAAAISFRALLRRLRLAAGLTQEALAERAGVSAKAVGELERDAARLPRLDTVALLADALGLEADERARFLAAARPDDAAPAAPVEPVAASPTLPRPLTPLIGREGVVGAVAELVRRGGHPLITLTGPGGVGKTRLAIAVTGRVADSFADGAVFVDLSPLRDPALVLPTLAGRLGLDARDATPLADRLASFLREKRLLLLLDNFEQLVAASDDLLQLLAACPSLIALVTSRTALRVRGEREYRVAPLELPTEDAPPEALALASAVALFIDRARAVGVEVGEDAATVAAVGQICRRLDGLPLAIELAAAWARLLPPATMLARLDRRLPLLVGGPHDLPARQRTMRDAIAWSYDLLEAPEQQLFRQFAVFVGGCTLEAAEAVGGGVPPGEAPFPSATLAGLAVLADRSLLRREDGDDEPRLTFLETIREYGLERLEERGEGGAARDRHAEYFLTLAEAAAQGLGGPDGLAWRARLARDHDNLRAALGWLLGRGEGERALRLAGALARFWAERGHLAEGRRWLREALAANAEGDGAASVARVRALAGAATLAIEQSDYDEAVELCERAVELAQGPERGRERAVALNARGLLARGRGRYAEAARDHEEAHALAVATGDRAVAAAALTGLSTVLGFTGDSARSLALAEQGVAAFRELGDARGLAEALLVLLWHATNNADFARVEALGGEAQALFRALGDTGRLAETLFTLGLTSQFQGRFDRATALHEEGLALRRGRGDERGAVEQLGALGWMALLQGERARAREMLQETLDILRRYDDPWNRAMSLAVLGQVELAEGDVRRAETLLGECAAIYRTVGNLLYVPWCLEGLAGVAAARGEWERAARLCGVREALIVRIASQLPPCHPEGFGRTMASIRSVLGEERFAAAQAAVEAIPLEDVLAEAASAPGDGAR